MQEMQESLGWCPRGGNGNPLFQYSCLEIHMGRGTWWSTVHGVTESWTKLSNWVHTQVPFAQDITTLHKHWPWVVNSSVNWFQIHRWIVVGGCIDSRNIRKNSDLPLITCIKISGKPLHLPEALCPFCMQHWRLKIKWSSVFETLGEVTFIHHNSSRSIIDM